MKRIKAIFSSLFTLGKDPAESIAVSWDRVKTSAGCTADDFHLIERIVLGAIDEAGVWTKKATTSDKDNVTAPQVAK